MWCSRIETFIYVERNSKRLQRFTFEVIEVNRIAFINLFLIRFCISATGDCVAKNLGW